MTAPFAALESRVNSAVFKRLANAMASYQGGAPFNVIFDRVPADPFSGAVDVSTRVCELDLAQVPGMAEGSELSINGMVFLVSGGVEPDASGWAKLLVYPKV